MLLVGGGHGRDGCGGLVQDGKEAIWWEERGGIWFGGRGREVEGQARRAPPHHLFIQPSTLNKEYIYYAITHLRGKPRISRVRTAPGGGQRRGPNTFRNSLLWSPGNVLSLVRFQHQKGCINKPNLVMDYTCLTQVLRV